MAVAAGNARCLEEARFDAYTTIERSLPVEIRTVDTVLAELRTRFQVRAPYLKLDTQGYDLEVVKGASRSLPEIRALQTEVYLRRVYEQAPTFDEAITWLQGLGFAVGHVEPNNATAHFPIPCDMDCVMVNMATLPA